MKVQSYGFEMIQWRVNNDQILTFGWTSNAFNVSWETISYDGTVLCTCPYCAQMCAQPLSIVMNERSAKDEARWKNKRSTHGNIYPHSHQLNICLTLSYLYRNHSHNTEYSIYKVCYDITSQKYVNTTSISLFEMSLLDLGRKNHLNAAVLSESYSWKMCARFKWIKAITCTFL